MPRPKKDIVKVQITIRIDPRILKSAREHGKYSPLIEKLLCKELKIDLGETT